MSSIENNAALAAAFLTLPRIEADSETFERKGIYLAIRVSDDLSRRIGAERSVCVCTAAQRWLVYTGIGVDDLTAHHGFVTLDKANVFNHADATLYIEETLPRFGRSTTIRYMNPSAAITLPGITLEKVFECLTAAGKQEGCQLIQDPDHAMRYIITGRTVEGAQAEATRTGQGLQRPPRPGGHEKK